MKPISITMDHLFRYGSKHNTFEFDKPLVLIIGDNGTGKSGILETISYVLFGKTIRFGTTFSDIVRRGQEWGAGTFVFEKEDLRYQVKRTWSNKNNGSTVSFKCLTTKQNLTSLKSKETNEKIEEIVGFNFETFRNSVLFGQFDFKRIVSLGPSDRMELVAELLSLDYIKRCSEVAKTRQLIIDSELEDIEISLERKDIRKIRKELRAAKELLEMFEEETEENNEQLKNKTGSLKKFKHWKDIFIQARTSYNSAKSFVDEQKERIERIRSKTKAINTDRLVKLEDLYKKSVKKYEMLDGLENELDEIEEKYSDIKEEIVILKTKRRMYKERVKNIKRRKACSECKREYDKGTKDKLIKTPKTKIEKIDSKVVILKKQLDEKQKEARDHKVEISTIKKFDNPELLNEKIEKLTIAKDFESEIESIEKSIISRRQKMKRAKIAIDEAKVEGYTEDKVDSLHKQLLTLKGKIESKRVEIEHIKKSIGSMNEELKKIKKAKGKVEDLKDKARLYSFLSGMFSQTGGLKQGIVENVLPRLNTKINNYLESLTDESIAVNFTTSGKTKGGRQRNKLDIQIITPKGEAKFESYSGGEKQVIVLAIGLGFAELASESSGISCEFLFLDEVFASLDKKAREKLLQLIHTLRKKFKTIVLISHIRELRSQMPNVVEIKKRKGISRIICV